MTRLTKASTEQMVEAYMRTGSVWKAAKELGMCGQSVHERLSAIGHPMQNRAWSESEIDEMKGLAVGGATITQIANMLGRPYGSVAGKLSENKIPTQNNWRRKQAIPRGAGYDKRAVSRHVSAIQKSGLSIRQYAIGAGLHLDPLIKAIQRHFQPFWESYVKARTDLTEKKCPNCGNVFYPMTKKQMTCSRQCSAHRRSDINYFGGNRNSAIGMQEGKCQLCGKEGRKGLSAHHIIGKKNDPENKHLVALCAGCHNILEALATRKFCDEAESWEALISLVLLRRTADDISFDYDTIHVTVEIEYYNDEEGGDPNG